MYRCPTCGNNVYATKGHVETKCERDEGWRPRVGYMAPQGRVTEIDYGSDMYRIDYHRWIDGETLENAIRKWMGLKIASPVDLPLAIARYRKG